MACVTNLVLINPMRQSVIQNSLTRMDLLVTHRGGYLVKTLAGKGG